MENLKSPNSSRGIREYLYDIKIFLRRLGFLLIKGRRYLGVPGFKKCINKYLKKLKSAVFFSSTKKIYWMGPFPPMHSNMGDHAQTLAVEQFFRNEFPEYYVIRYYRDKISLDLIKRIALKINKDDLVFIHSSGDFGSKYHDTKNSYCQKRKDIISALGENRIIHLPTTVYYEDTEQAEAILEQDKDFYKDKGVVLMGRESVSADFLAQHFSCQTLFFPDFVFYLKPKIRKNTKKGALFLLRSDHEAGLDERDKLRAKEIFRKFGIEVDDTDIMTSSIPVNDLNIDRYIESIFDIYQQYEFVVTDRMHGMITAVITKTRCIAIDEKIPHKISAYKPFLSQSVEFVDEVDEIEAAITKIRNTTYKETDMSQYYSDFRKTFNLE